MLDSSTRPMTTTRVGRIIRGLQQRSQATDETARQRRGEVEEQLTQLEQSHLSERERLSAQKAAERAREIHQWDEATHRKWDAAEQRTYRAIYETAEREGVLRKAAKEASEDAKQELRRIGQSLEKQFLVGKDASVHNLRKSKEKLAAHLSELSQVARNAEAALAQRSLSLPEVKPPIGEDATAAEPSSVDECLAAIQELQQTAKSHFARLHQNKLVKFFESWLFWAVAGTAFLVLAAVLIATQVLAWPLALVVAFCSILLTAVANLLAARPWIKKIALIEYPQLQACVTKGQAFHNKGMKLAMAANDRELRRLAAERDRKFEEAKAERQKRVSELQRKLKHDIQLLQQHAQSEKEAASSLLTRELRESDSSGQNRVLEVEKRFESRLEELDRDTDQRRTRMQTELREYVSDTAVGLKSVTQRMNQRLTAYDRWCQQCFVDWRTLADRLSDWPATLQQPVLPIGTIQSSRDAFGSHVESDSPSKIPGLFVPLQDRYLTITGDPSHPAVIGLVRSLLARAVSSLPAGNTQVCVIDPPGLGRDFGWLMHLGDFDPDLVHHRVWTQPGHVARKLSELTIAAEDFIQQSLRNRYSDIVHYNAEAGALAEPFRFLVWCGVQHGLDDSSWKSLQSLLDVGARCGIIPILVIDPAASWPAPEHERQIRKRGLHLELNASDGSFQLPQHRGEPLIVNAAEPPSDNEALQIVERVGQRALLASRVEVPMSEILPEQDKWWKADASSFLEIPIGRSGVDRVHSLKLGLGTSQHAIIAGKTGSGKSSLLHSMLTSAALKYSPEQLRLVLLDFKRGVEFQVYSESELPHADIIGIESHREFGLSALRYVDGCLSRRGAEFRNAGVQDLPSWNAKHPEARMPRMLIVIDEFQELFVEDDRLASEASLMLDRLVRQGRSFGVHAVLSSQTISGAYSLPRATLGQMNVRIALQCDPSDAQIVLSEDNPAASRLKHPGQAVYNDAAGKLEGNQPLQIGWLSKAEQQQLFSALPHGYQNQDTTSNTLGRAVVFDGNKQARWDAQQAELAIKQAEQDINRDANWCVLGESVAIEPAVVIPLTAQAGRNTLIVGATDWMAAAVTKMINACVVRCSLAKSARKKNSSSNPSTHEVAANGPPNARGKLICVQGARPTDGGMLQLPREMDNWPCEVEMVEARDAERAIKQLHAELQQRLQEEDTEGTADRASIVLNLIQLGRLRELKASDEFALGGFGDSELTADRCLDDILRDGPSQGIHTVIWAENYSAVNRMLSRSAMRECEIRLLMQVSSSDSTNLVDSVAATKLGEHVMLAYDEATGQETKFRPYELGSLENVDEWLQQSETIQ